MLDVAVFVAYFIAVLMIGRISSRRIQTSEDFHLCGRKLGRIPAALSLAATEFNGSGLIGGAGLAYAIGISGIYWNDAAVLGVLSQALWYREIDGWLGAIHPLFLGPALCLIVLLTASFVWPAAASPSPEGETA